MSCIIGNSLGFNSIILVVLSEISSGSQFRDFVKSLWQISRQGLQQIPTEVSKFWRKFHLDFFFQIFYIDYKRYHLEFHRISPEHTKFCKSTWIESCHGALCIGRFAECQLTEYRLDKLWLKYFRGVDKIQVTNSAFKVVVQVFIKYFLFF